MNVADLLADVTLQGDAVRLEPLRAEHLDALTAVGLDPDLWTFVPTRVASRDDMEAYVREALEGRAKGTYLPFVIRSMRDDSIVGSTRYAAIVPVHKRLEIGWTWIARAYQRTAINTEAKLLLLNHAFETLRYHRVELKTDALNLQSRRAIERLGATQEGIFRRHAIADTGRVRDTVYFSIVDAEWPQVKQRLEGFLGATRATDDRGKRLGGSHPG